MRSCGSPIPGQLEQMTRHLVGKLLPLVTLDYLWTSVTADQLVQEASKSYTLLVIYSCASDYEAVASRNLLQGPTRSLVESIAMNINVVKL